MLAKTVLFGIKINSPVLALITVSLTLISVTSPLWPAKSIWSPIIKGRCANIKMPAKKLPRTSLSANPNAKPAKPKLVTSAATLASPELDKAATAPIIKMVM